MIFESITSDMIILEQAITFTCKVHNIHSPAPCNTICSCVLIKLHDGVCWDYNFKILIKYDLCME